MVLLRTIGMHHDNNYSFHTVIYRTNGKHIVYFNLKIGSLDEFSIISIDYTKLTQIQKMYWEQISIIHL